MSGISKNKMRLAMLIALATIVGCVLREEPGVYKTRPIRFSHITHVTKEKWKCESCHKDFKTSDQAGRPDPRNCRKCHQTQKEIDKFLKPFAPEKKLIWSEVADLKDEIIFSHKLHYEKKVECLDCHAGILSRKEVFFSARCEKDACLDCHIEKNVNGECKACHKTITEKTKPPDHIESWKLTHGQTARSGYEDAYSKKCAYCHTDASCAKCHAVEKPRDHNNAWRNLTHGIAAGMDRSGCATCHNNYTCVTCHKETSPRNHVGNWGNPRNRHCATCHLPLNEQGCGACHLSMPGHLAAKPAPAGMAHSTAGPRECLACHRKLGDMRHIDNGDNCRACHR